MSAKYDDVEQALKQLLSLKALGVIGRSVDFIRRLRAIHAGHFVWAVVLSRFETGRPAFEKARIWFQRLSRRTIFPRPFQIRFKSRAAVALFERAFEKVSSRWRNEPALPPFLRKHFSDIAIVDGTMVQLADQLRSAYPGGRKAKAALKVTLAISLCGLLPLWARICGGAVNDSKLFPPLSLFRKGTLFLFDKGYNAYQRLRDIIHAGHFFLTRMRFDGNPRIISMRQGPAFVRKLLKQGVLLRLRDVLPKHKRTGRLWDIDVLLESKSGVTVVARLVIFRGNTQAVPQRLYLTNLSPTSWSALAISELYRCRWQIELVFKELKQHLSLTAMPSRDRFAVKVFAWASLIALAVSRTLACWLCPIAQLLGLNSPIRLLDVSQALRSALTLFSRLPRDIIEPRLIMRSLHHHLLTAVPRTRTSHQASIDRLQPLLIAS